MNLTSVITSILMFNVIRRNVCQYLNDLEWFWSVFLPPNTNFFSTLKSCECIEKDGVTLTTMQHIHCQPFTKAFLLNKFNECVLVLIVEPPVH